MSTQFSKVTVVGAGTMGAGIAQVCAQAGSDVVLCDIDQSVIDRALTTISKSLDKGVAKGKVTAEQSEATRARIATSVALADAAAGANLVVEAVPERLELKQQTFATAAAAAGPEAVLATNTSSLALGKIFADVDAPGRCIGMHFFNPVPIMALLEIVRPEATSDATLAAVRAYAEQLGKDAIVVRDSPGFATSRLGVCLGLEAIRMVEAEVASPGDIDKAMELGYRHPMGPLKLTDLVGLDVRLAIADYLRAELDSPAFEAPRLMRDMVAAGKLGKKSGQGFYAWDA